MSCTTILVGRNASNDRSTMIARTDDGHFDVKKMIVVEPKKQPRKYKSVLSHLEIELPEEPMRYTACPSVDKARGIWAATGINAANVGMTATETITSNPRVLSADPLVEYKEAKSRREKATPGGIGEEDIVVLVLPYIRSAREGVLRLASLLEKYGTYESNGIAFNDQNEVWWLETIGGHHWMARKIPDDAVVIAPNQFAMDSFDLDDAFGRQEAHLCSADLREFIAENHLDLNRGGVFNPRDVFGSRRDMDHVYNTPRAWYMGRWLTPYSHRWEGENYAGTPYNPYTKHDNGKRGIYRSIGINRTGVSSICQIRPYVPDAIKGLEWVSFGSTTFAAWLPVYTNAPELPGFLSRVTTDVSTDNLYWCSRLIGALADKCYAAAQQNIERYQNAVAIRGLQLVREYDRRMAGSGDFSLTAEANTKLCAMCREESIGVLNKVLLSASEDMKNGFNLADN